MARPHKTGLSYFPHDTDAANDGKIHSLVAMFGTDGYAFYFILLENIFRTENGRITCGKLCEQAGWAKAIGISVERFNAILEIALEVGCFDKAVYDAERMLTSNGIQKRIESIVNLRAKDRNRKEVLSKDNTKRKRKVKNGKPMENSRKILENPRKTPVFHVENSDFVDFYNKYPKKKDRRSALKAWEKLRPDENLIKIIMIALENAKITEDWQKENGKYIPLPATWLNGARWEDEHTVDTKPALTTDQIEHHKHLSEQYRIAMGGKKDEP